MEQAGHRPSGPGSLGQPRPASGRRVRLVPDSPGVQNNLGTILLLRGKLDEAREILEHACELRTGYAEAWNNLGLVELKLGRLVKSPRVRAGVAIQSQPGPGVVPISGSWTTRRADWPMRRRASGNRSPGRRLCPGVYQMGVVLKDHFSSIRPVAGWNRPCESSPITSTP